MKNTFKKIMAAAVALMLLLGTAACAAGQENTVVPSDGDAVVSDTQTAAESTLGRAMNVAALNGPTGVSMAQLAHNAADGEKYSVTFAGSPDELVGKITTGEVDAACVPTNLAAVLYAKTSGDIRVCAVTTLGVLYLLDTTGEINEIADLEGKSIGATGEGSNPEYILNRILKENGLTAGENVQVDYYAEHSELASLMLAGDVKTAMLPVPFATQVQMKLEGVNVINLQTEWAKISDEQLAQGVIVTTGSFADNHKAELDGFLADFAASTDFVLNDTETTAGYVEELGILPSAALAAKAIPSCNIVYIDGAEMKKTVSGFLGVLYESNPKSVGGAMPSDDFYYGA